VLITGGSRGIGLATARRFSEQGTMTALLGRDEETLRSAALVTRRLLRRPRDAGEPGILWDAAEGGDVDGGLEGRTSARVAMERAAGR
jgi:NAD(P)-dependent dehydrogenase (short-subunit alcohol dehydrogenase family)